jgi:hypothetical protein
MTGNLTHSDGMGGEIERDGGEKSEIDDGHSDARGKFPNPSTRPHGKIKGPVDQFSKIDQSDLGQIFDLCCC